MQKFPRGLPGREDLQVKTGSPKTSPFLQVAEQIDLISQLKIKQL